MAGRIPTYDPTAPTGPVRAMPKANCPGCHRDRPVRKDGTFREHTRTRWLKNAESNYGPRAVQTRCPGSGQRAVR